MCANLKQKYLSFFFGKKGNDVNDLFSYRESEKALVMQHCCICAMWNLNMNALRHKLPPLALKFTFNYVAPLPFEKKSGLCILTKIAQESPPTPPVKILWESASIYLCIFLAAWSHDLMLMLGIPRCGNYRCGGNFSSCCQNSVLTFIFLSQKTFVL